MSETQENMVGRWFQEVWNQGRRQTIDELLAPECVIHDGPTSLRGPAEFQKFFDRMHADFTNIHVTMHDIISAGDMASARWTVSMKPKAGAPGGGKEIRVTGMCMIRFGGGRFQEAWQNWDMLGIMEQMGTVPPSDMYLGSRETSKSKAAE